MDEIKKSEYCFIIGPLQKYLEFVAEDESPIDCNIDNYPDISPSYELLRENPIIEDYIEGNTIDENDYYLSFFQ